MVKISLMVEWSIIHTMTGIQTKSWLSKPWLEYLTIITLSRERGTQDYRDSIYITTIV